MNTIPGPGNLTDLKISFKNSWQSEFHLLILVLLYELHVITTDSRELPVRWFLRSWVFFDNYYSEFLPSLFLQNFSWRKVDLQCCVIFCCTESTESCNRKIVFYIYNCFCLVLINKFVSFSSCFFFRFYPKEVSQDVCTSLSSLCIWQSRSLCIAANGINFILCYTWVTFRPIHMPHLLYPFLCWWTFRLFSCLGYCK